MDDTCDHGFYVQKLKSRVCKKENKIATGRRDDQSAISSKEHVKYEATQNKHIFVSCVPTRPLARGRHTITATESEITATTKHAILQRVFSRKTNTKRVRSVRSRRMHATHWFLPWILSTFTTSCAWRNSEISRHWSFKAELCASGVLDAHTNISRRWEFPPSRYFVIFFQERCGLLVVRAWERPTCNYMASTHTAHDCPTAQTQPTAARMKPLARHHE